MVYTARNWDRYDIISVFLEGKERVLFMRFNVDISYADLMKKHQEEVNRFPLGFAFDKEQFREMMKKFGLNPETDLGEIVSLGAGAYLKKCDVDTYVDMCNRHKEEREACMKSEKEGKTFLCHMFYQALSNTEYGYTGDESDAIEQLGYTMEDIKADRRLAEAFEKAKRKIRSGC